MDIRTALNHLDPANEDHWTAQGFPRVDAVSDILGVEITRADITNANPGFTRAALHTADRLPEAVEFEASESVPEVAERSEVEGTDREESNPPAADPRPPAADRSVPILSGKDLPEGSVLLRPMSEVSQNPELLAAASAELTEIHDRMVKERRDLDAKIKFVAGKSEVISIVLARQKKSPESSEGIREFLKRQSEAREDKAARARAFIDAGTTAKDVAAALDPRSKIDAVMSQRKPSIGSTRPAPRIPVRR